MINPKHIYFQSHQLRKLVIPFFLFSDNQAGYSNVISGTLSYMVRGMGYVTQSGTVGQWGCAQLEHYFSILELILFGFQYRCLHITMDSMIYLILIQYLGQSRVSLVFWVVHGCTHPVSGTYWWLTDWQHRDTLLPTCF